MRKNLFIIFVAILATGFVGNVAAMKKMKQKRYKTPPPKINTRFQKRQFEQKLLGAPKISKRSKSCLYRGVNLFGDKSK